MQTSSPVLSVFLVDDDVMYLNALRLSLVERYKSIRVKTFTSGEDCLDHVSEKPDLIILDYCLDGRAGGNLNGVDVLREIKAKSKDTAVVILTGQDKAELAAESLRFGAYEYMVKSKTVFQRLQNMMRNFISNVKLEAEVRNNVRWNYGLAFLLVLFVLADLLFFYLRK